LLRLTQLSILAAAAAMFMVPGAAKAGAVCGPGSHWVDTCAGGTYDFSSTSTIAVSLDLDRNGSLETTIPFLQFSGITQVFLGAGQNNSDPHSIQTELYNLTKSTLAPGPRFARETGHLTMPTTARCIHPAASLSRLAIRGSPIVSSTCFLN
jgi:hypothetical protein